MAKKIWLGIAALALLFGLVLAGCDSDNDSSSSNSGGGSVPDELIGTWKSKAYGTEAFTITAKKLTLVGGSECDVSVSGSKVTIKLSGNDAGSFDYSISNGEMTGSNLSGGFASITNLFPLVKDGGGGDDVAKPSALASNATYQEAVAKLDEIIAYCNANPNATNTVQKGNAEGMKDGVTADIYAGAKSAIIENINDMISLLSAGSGEGKV